MYLYHNTYHQNEYNDEYINIDYRPVAHNLRDCFPMTK